MGESTPSVRVKAVTAAVAGAAILAVSAPAQAATPTVSVSTGLTPSFSRSITDYVTKCSTGSVSVTTNVPRGTSLKVDGKTAKAGRSTTKVAMTAGQRFIVISRVGSSSVAHSIRCLPADFPGSTTTGKLPSSVDFVALSIPTLGGLGQNPIPYAWVVDSRGTPIWWKHLPGDAVMDVKPIPGKRIGTWHGELTTDIDNAGKFTEYYLDGTKHRDIPIWSNYGMHDSHEALPIGFGHYYVIADVGRPNVDVSAFGGGPKETIFDNLIEEIDSEGNLFWTWNAGDHIPVGEANRWLPILTNPAGVPLLDAYHINSVEEDGKGGLILSFRYLDAVIRVEKSTGEITWKLGGTPTSKSLTVIGDDAAPGGLHLMGQHDARVQADGTITVYDNGSGPNMRRPRVTRWRIDPEAKTATLVESFGDPDVPAAFAGGGARRFADGSWLVSWCHSPWIKAYDANHRQVFGLKFASGGRSYRAAPITSSQITRFDFVAGMDAQYPRR